MSRVLTTIPVHCLNCTTATSDTLARLSLIVAGAAFAVAVVALYIAGREHVVFVKQLQARASLNLTADLTTGVDPDDPDMLGVAATDVNFYVRIGVSNGGTKASGPTVINVLAPPNVAIAWCDHRGMVPSGAIEPLPTSEKVQLPDGREIEAHWLEKTVPRVSLRGGQVAWFRMQSGVPADLPVRIKAQSDELPDDVDEVTLDRLLRVRAVV